MNITSITSLAANNVAETVSLPGSSQAYVAVLTLVGNGTNFNITPPANWTLLEAERGSDAGWTEVTAYYANASSSPGTGWAYDTEDDWTIIIIGLDEPISYIEDAWTNNSIDTSTLAVTSPSLDADQAAVIIRVIGSDVYSAQATMTYPGGTSNQTTVQKPGTGDHPVIAIGTSTVSGAGATGTAAWAADGTSTWYHTVTGTIAVGGAVTAASSPPVSRRFPGFFFPMRDPMATPLQLLGDATTAVAVNATVTAVAIATTTGLPAPAVQTGSTVAATAIVTTAAMAAPAVQQGQTVSATVVATTAALSAPAVQTGSTVTAVEIATTTGMPAPGVVVPGQVDAYQAGPQVAWMFLQPSGASLQLKGDATSPALTTDATVVATAIATVTALPAPTVQTGSTVAATAVATVTAMPTPVVQTGSTVSAVTVATVTDLPAPSIPSSGSVTVQPVTIATVTALPTLAVQQGQTVAATAIATVTALPAPAVGVETVITPTAIATVTTLPASTVQQGQTVSASAVATVIALPVPTVQGNVAVGIQGNVYPRASGAITGSASPGTSGGIIGSVA